MKNYNIIIIMNYKSLISQSNQKQTPVMFTGVYKHTFKIISCPIKNNKHDLLNMLKYKITNTILLSTFPLERFEMYVHTLYAFIFYWR